MHPALSVILFTTLSGAGYGLLAWLGIWLARLQLSPPRPVNDSMILPSLLLVSAVFATLLVTSGLISSLFHLGKPGRAWRAFSQWRTSWLSREGVMALMTYVPVFLLILLLFGLVVSHDSSVLVLSRLAAALGISITILCLITVGCTAMIYASLKPVPAWRHQLVVPVYLLFALFTGGLLLSAIASLIGASIGNVPAIASVALAMILWLLKKRYWRDIDATPLPASRGDAVGLPDRKVTVFERPHTEANYLTREMAFVVARKHSKWLRLLAVALFALLPILCMLPVWLFVHIDAAPWFTVAAISALAGAFVERWLFFAEAKHLVTLYY